MKKIFQHISLFCCVCIPALLGSCTSERMGGDVTYSAAEVGGEVDLALSVRIGNTTGMPKTRDGEDTPADGENTPVNGNFEFEQSKIEYELIKTLRIIVVRPDYTVEYNRFINLGDKNAVATLADDPDLKFRVSTDLGQVDNTNMTCTERKRIYLIANEASLNTFRSNMTGDGQTISQLLDGLRPAYNPSNPYNKVGNNDGNNNEGETGNEAENAKKEVGYLGDKLSPYVAERWIIYNEWPEGVDNPGVTAVPIINNNVADADKKYIPMTEFFDVDVVSTWKRPQGEEGSDDDPIPVIIPEQKADLFITRNFVKFIFTAHSDSESFRITDIRFHNLMQKEYLFPCNTTYVPEKAVNDLSDRLITKFQTPGYADNFIRPYQFKPEDMTFKTVAAGGTGTAVGYAPPLYFCETHNYESNDNSLSLYGVGIGVEYLNNDGTVRQTKSYAPVTLPNLPHSLPRNTIVKVDITVLKQTIEANVMVYPYTPVDLNPEFGFSAPEKDKLTLPPTLTLDMNDPEHREALLYATYTSENNTKIDNLFWVASNVPNDSDPSKDPIILLSNNEPEGSQLNVIGESVELPYEDPVRVIPQRTGQAKITVYSQTGLVATCIVTVK